MRLKSGIWVAAYVRRCHVEGALAVTKILERFGCTVCFPRAQTCCGQPFFNNGFHPEARELAKRFEDHY
jgi:L-lactate dehydrogenase complex protein LldE